MSDLHAESVTASLVREYLSRKGLKTTLQVLDEEYPRDDTSISNRQQLVKELHIEKLMKKNKDQTRPLKAMLEVITLYLLGNKIIAKTSDTGGDRPASPARGHLRSAQSSRTQYPTVDDNDFKFDGFPASEQNEEEDDLLKPDPNFSYPSHRRKAKHNPVTVSSKKPDPKVHSNSSDLVIEDNVEGETILGGGRSGVMQKDEVEDQLPTRGVMTRPRSGAKPRSLAMAGPITNTEDSRRKFHKPRPMSASKNQRLDIFENGSPKISSLENVTNSNPKPAAKPLVISSKPLQSRASFENNSHPSVKEIETLITETGHRKSIQDVLEIESGRPSTGTRRQSSVEKETKHYSVNQSSIAKKSSKPSSSAVKVGDVEMGDLDDLDQDLAKLSVGPRITSAQINKSQHNCKPIDVKTAVALKTLVFGTPLQNFNDEWRFQSFSFSDMPKLKYGIVQKKGGPCGVLASVQASVLQELLFGEKKIPAHRFSEASCQERTEALATALAKILWRAGEKRKAVVCIPSSRPVIGSGGKFKADELIETLSLYTFIDFENLLSFMKQVVGQYELDGLGGVVLSLYSVILSRKLDGVREDMDEPSGKLMGAHGYCTQDMVNLYLSGRAVSNVFNDVMELDSGDGNIMILKGIVSRCDAGLLSLFEHYRSCQVGTYLKTPRFPIWVVCSESHFSILFCMKRELTSDWKAEKRFDLYYYDGLARQQEEIRLTIDTNAHYEPPSEETLVPPLEHCIRTKWEGAEVDWNGTEPLL